MDVLIEKVRFVVASWVSVLPLFHDFPLASILRCWKEVAFSSSLKHQCLLKWQTPALDFYMLNINGSAIGNPGLAGMGGIIRDCVGVSISFLLKPSGCLICK